MSTLFGMKLAEGKTKIVYAHPKDPDLAYLMHKDDITAGDGARHHVIPGKGALAGRTIANVFRLLNHHGLRTHFLEAPEPNISLVRICTMVPLEVVVRRRAYGSYLKRHPEVPEGFRFDPPLVEFFLKDDALHDPLITEEEIEARGIADQPTLHEMIDIARRAFVVLEEAWAAEDVEMVDLKVEFGRDSSGTLMLADVIDNDSWRIWPKGDKARMLDKQVYRNLPEVTQEALDRVRALYQQVADLTEGFVAGSRL